MIIEILTGSGGDSVLFARYTGGDSVLVNKKEWVGDSVRGGFCPTLISYKYLNAISGFEYSHNFLTCNIVMS